MIIAVVLVSWVLLTLPAAVLMGRCISYGLTPPAMTAAAVTAVPEQRSAVEDAPAVVRSRA